MNTVILPSFSSFKQIIDFYNNIPETERPLLYKALREKWSSIAMDVDILSNANLFFLIIVDIIETLGRGNKFGCYVAFTYLKLQYSKHKDTLDGFLYVCNPYLHYDPSLVQEAPCLSYNTLGDMIAELNQAKKLPIIGYADWQVVYLIVHAIYNKKERFSGTWTQTASYFYENFILEDAFIKFVPGVSYYSRGVRHDMLCPVHGTGDPDFIYETNTGHKLAAEFKQPTKTVEALAHYGLKNPTYIYNAKILFTYGRTDYGEIGFYKIDYTKPPFAIEAVPVSDELINIIKSTGGI